MPKLIAGPGVHICSNCIRLCNDLLTQAVDSHSQDEQEDEESPEDKRVALWSHYEWFDPSMAGDIGIHETLLFRFIADLLQDSVLDDVSGSRRFAEGQWWVRLQFYRFEDRFSFLTPEAIARTLRSLQKQKLVISRNNGPGNEYEDRWYGYHPTMLRALQESSRLPSPPKRDRPGYVYLISGGGHYKIGKTSNLHQRHRQVSLKMPFETTLIHAIKTEDMDSLEQDWHNRFAAQRINGEWFNLTPEDVAAFCA